MSKMMITGIELSAGVSKKNGNAYSIGQLHTMIQLAPARGADNIAKGYVGRSYECPAEVLKKLQALPFPLEAQVETQEQMLYGKPQVVVVDVKPGTLARVAA